MSGVVRRVVHESLWPVVLTVASTGLAAQMSQIQTAQTQTAQSQTAQSQTAQSQTAQSQTAQSQTAQSQNEARVSLYVTLRAKNGDTPRELKPAEMAVTDAGRMVDSREMRLSFAPADRPPVLTFLFDRMRPAGTRAAVRSAEDLLAACALHTTASGVLSSVWALDAQLRIVEPYTVDASEVRKAIGRVAASTFNPTEPGELLSQTDLAGMSLAAASRIVAEQRVGWSYAALLAATRTQRQRPGRKAIVLFTERTAYEVDSPDLYRELRQALKDAHVALYVVDVNALDEAQSQQMIASNAMGGQAANNYYTSLATMHSTAPLGTTMGMGAMGFRAMKDAITNIEMGVGQPNGNPLAVTAAASGGTYSFVDEGAKKLARQLMADLTAYMTVSYTIPADQQDGRFHAVSVKPLKPGIFVGAQPGYFAALGTDEAGGGLLRRVANAVPDAPMEGDPVLLEKDAAPADLPMRTAVLRLGRATEGLRTVVAAEVPAGELRVREDEHTRLFALHATVGVEWKDAAGKVVARFEEEFRRRGAIEAERELAGEVVSFARPVTLPPGTYTLDWRVRDWNADAVSRRTESVTLDVADGGTALSDLVVVRGTRAASAGAEEIALQYGEKRVIPDLSGRMDGKERMTSLYFQIYPVPGKAGSRKVTLSIAKDGNLIATMPLQSTGTPLEGTSTRVLAVPLKQGAGRYEMTVRLEEGDRTVERRTSIIVTEVAEVPEAPEDKPLDAAATREMAVEAGLPPTGNVNLSTAESAVLIETTRANALRYTERLPNFLCLETIARSADHAGTGAWKARDTLVESLRYRDRVEERTVVRVNGEKSSLAADHVEGATSNGEFGSLLRAIFEPDARAEFVWVKTEEANGERLEVYRLRVAGERSQFMVTDHTNSKLRAAFHGFVFVDAATRTVRRLFMQTEGLPRDFGVRSSWIAMNYDYVAINDHDYLLPSRGEVGLQQGKHEVLLNEVAFSDYRRFGAKGRMTPAAGEAQP